MYNKGKKNDMIKIFLFILFSTSLIAQQYTNIEYSKVLACFATDVVSLKGILLRKLSPMDNFDTVYNVSDHGKKVGKYTYTETTKGNVYIYNLSDDDNYFLLIEEDTNAGIGIYDVGIFSKKDNFIINSRCTAIE